MRILWFNHRDIRHPKAGGAERTIYEVGRRLAARGYELHLASVNPGNLPKEEMLDGIIIHRASGNVMAHLTVPLMIKRLKPDIIVDDMAHVIPWYSPFFTDARVIVFFRHLHARSLPGQVPMPLAHILEWFERTYPLVYCNSIFATETSTGMEDIVHLGIRKGIIRKIPPGVDTELFRRGKKTEMPSLVYFGGMRKYKRPWLAVEVLKMLSQIEGITLTVIGEGKALEKMKGMSDRCGLGIRIIFAGRIPDGELADIVAASWVNLHFSMTEGFGLSILEAAAAGTPTVALDAPGVSEIVNEFGLGKTVRDLEEFPWALSDVLDANKSWSERVNASAALFSWDECTEKWECVLDGKKESG